MSYCPKCGNEVNETMAFCPHCGTALKGPPTDQTAPSQTNNLEKMRKKKKISIQKRVKGKRKRSTALLAI